jgi:hypothetical protein
VKTNISSTLTLLRKDCITVVVTFNENERHNPQNYTYKALKKDNFQIGDTAVVEARGVIKLVTIKEVHTRPRLDPQAGFSYKWIMQKIDRTEHDRLKEQERLFEELLLDAEQERVREEMRETLINQITLGQEQAKALDRFLNGE